MPRRSHNEKRRIEGRCIDCGDPAEFGKRRCEPCLMDQRVKKRERGEHRERMVKFETTNPTYRS